MDELIAFGATLKARQVDDETGIVEALGVRFSDPSELDLYGDYFDARTDFGPHKGNGMAATLNHRMPMHTDKTSGPEATKMERLSKLKFGNPVVAEMTDAGILARHVLDLRDEYERMIFELASQGKLSWSSGTAPHMVDRGDDGHIRTWHIVEWAYTPTPAEHRLPSIMPAKSYVELVKTWAEQASGSEVQMPEDARSASAQSTEAEQVDSPPNRDAVSDTTEDSKMEAPNVNKGVDQEALTAEAMKALLTEWKAEMVTEAETKAAEAAGKSVETLNEQISGLMDMLEDQKMARMAEDAGYISNIGGTADPEVKSFGDFCLAVRRKDTKRLVKVYGSQPDGSDTKALELGDGSGAGWLVPMDYSTELMRVSEIQSPVMSRVRVIPVGVPAGSWPALDQYTAPSTAGNGDTAFAGGVTAAMTAEGEALTETEPDFSMLEWRVHKIGGITKINNELIADSPQTIDALLSGLFGIAVGAKMEKYVIRGDGAGEPLGILNSGAIVNVTPDTDGSFTWPDVASMTARLRSVGGQAIWLAHPSVWPDILQMEIGTAGANAWTANMQAGQGGTINGYPIVNSEHSPQKGNAGGVVLADLSAYIVWRREGLSIAFSEHVDFANDRGTWRFTARADGKPWLKDAITLADPQGSYEVSPFVVHND